MARHRDIRNMDYSDDYDGYDDVYGHSMDDDYYISPSNRQFLYNRENSGKSSEGDIKEEDEVEAEMTDSERVKLESCVDEMKNILGTINIPRSDLVDLIISHKYEVEKTLNAILEDPKYKQIEISDKKEKDVRMQPNKFIIPKLNNNLTNINQVAVKKFSVPKLFHTSDIENKSFSKSSLTGKKCVIPNIFNRKIDEETTKTNNFIIPKLTSSNSANFPNKNFNLCESDKDNCEFNTLSELVSNHLSKTPCKIDFQNNQKSNLALNTYLKETVNQMIDLQLSDSKSLSSVEHNMSPVTNDWHIDLSKALKSTNSLPSVSKNSKKNNFEKFDIPFVDCEQQISPKNKLLPCNLDVSNILLVSSKYEKACSNFGKVICLNFKRHRVVLKNSFKDMCIRKIKRFDFENCSPDDFISSHLKR